MNLIAVPIIFLAVVMLIEFWIGVVYLKIAKAEWSDNKLDALFFVMMSMISFGGGIFVGAAVFVLSGVGL